MNVSVIVCTYNRCTLLRNALQSIASSVVPTAVEWEVLVVDNNSTDRTRDVVEDFCRQHPGRFRYLSEPRQGISNARNAGIVATQSDVLVFTDDDVTVNPDWLWNLIAPLKDMQWAGAAGRVIPSWTCPPPHWFPVEHPWGSIVAFDPDLGPGPLTIPPLGVNMAFRKAVFEKYGNFRADLGRCGSGMLSNEDIEFGRRLLDRGERLRYEPSAIVYHPIPENRLRKDYILAWWFGKGRADVREEPRSLRPQWRVAGIPFYLFPRLGIWILRWTFALKPSRRFDCKICVWCTAGAMVECLSKSFFGSPEETGASALRPTPTVRIDGSDIK